MKDLRLIDAAGVISILESAITYLEMEETKEATKNKILTSERAAEKVADILLDIKSGTLKLFKNEETSK